MKCGNTYLVRYTVSTEQKIAMVWAEEAKDIRGILMHHHGRGIVVNEILSTKPGKVKARVMWVQNDTVS